MGPAQPRRRRRRSDGRPARRGLVRSFWPLGAPADGRPRTPGRRPGRGLPRLRRRPAGPLVRQRAAQGGAGLVRRAVRPADVRARHRRDGRLGRAAARRPARPPRRRLRRADRGAAPAAGGRRRPGRPRRRRRPPAGRRTAGPRSPASRRRPDGGSAPAPSSPPATSAPPGRWPATTPLPPWPTPTRRSATASASSSARSTDALPAYPGVPAERVAAGAAAAVHRPRRSSPPRTATGRPAGCPASPVPLAMCFSASDDTLAPPGQHVVTIWGQWYPYALADGADWDALADAEAARLVAAVDRYAPGFADSVQRLYVQTPLALERELSLPRGNVMHVEMGLASMFGFRPTPGAVRLPRARPGRALPGRRLHPPRRRGLGQLRPDGGPRAARRPAGRCARAARRAAAGRRPRRSRAGDGRRRRPAGARPAARPRCAAAGARRCCWSLTAIAYPLTSGAGPRRVSWAIVAARRRRCRSATPALSRGARTGARRCSCWSPSSRWRSRRWAWPPASPTAATPTATPSGPTLLGVPVPRAAGLADDGVAELGARRPADAPVAPAGGVGAHRRGRGGLRRLGRRPRPADGRRPATGPGRTRPRAARHRHRAADQPGRLAAGRRGAHDAARPAASSRTAGAAPRSATPRRCSRSAG